MRLLQIRLLFRRIRFNYHQLPKSRKAGLALIVFSIICMIIGVLVVYWSLTKLVNPCGLVFKQVGNTSISFSSQPRSVVLADFNNDSYLDIVVANSGTDTIGIFYSYGNSTFSNETTYSTGLYSYPCSIVVSDFNDDNVLDIAVANYETNNIGIFFGYENGTFDEQIEYSTNASRPVFIIKGDFNNDNQADIAVANNDTDTIGIILINGDGTFQDAIIISTGYDSNPCSLAIGDFNNDHYLDIAVANYGTNNIGVLLGYGNGSFQNIMIYTTDHNSHPSSITVGDLNLDQQLEILVANYGTGNIGVFYGLFNGTFEPQITYSITSNLRPSFITVDDIDRDGILDVIVIDSDNDQIHVLLQQESGTFSLSTTYDGITQSQPSSLVVTNLGKDKLTSIVVANSGTNNILVLIGYGIQPSVRQKTYAGQAGSGPSSVVIGNLNDDDNLDIACNAIQDGIIILSGLGNENFAKTSNYSTGIASAPQNIRIADLNNDNRMDIISANTGSNTIGILLAQDNGSFAQVVTYFLGNNFKPWDIVPIDINNDNYVDIVSINTVSSSVSILFGYGNGTFGTIKTYPVGDGSNAGPRAIAVGDVNNDNRLDIITANSAADNISVLLSDSNGTFSVKSTYSTGTDSSPSSLSLGDFNGDEWLDIVVANTYTNNIGIFLGNENGTFDVQKTYATGDGSRTYCVIVVDIDGDGISDIVVTNYGIDQIVILYGDGTGAFELRRRYLMRPGSRPYGIAATRINNDTKLMLVAALWAIDSIAIFTEYNGAAFGKQSTYLTGSAPQSYSIAVGDFNHDNRSDIVVANSGTDNIGILIGLGNGTFKEQITYSTGIDSHPQFVIVKDINKDYQLDIITANTKSDSIAIFLGSNNGTFAQPWIYTTGYGSEPSALTVGDLNHDNRSDIVVVNRGTDEIGIFFGFDYVSFDNFKSYSSGSNDQPYGIVVSDFNNDRYLDVAACFSQTYNIGVRLGDGNGNFGPMVSYSTGVDARPTTMTIGDINGDDNYDILVPNTLTHNVGIFLGYGNGSFAPVSLISTGNRSYPIAVAVGDFNNDIKLDVVVALSRSDKIGVMIGYGNGSFDAMMSYSTGTSSFPFAAIVGGFNDDVYTDIVVVNRNAANIGIFLGYGNGSFASQITFSTGIGSTPYWVDVADFNNDNRTDIAVANYNTNNVGIFLNLGNGSFASMKRYSTGDGSTPSCIAVGNYNDDNIYDIAITKYGSNEIVILFGFGDGTFLLGRSYSTGVGSVPSALATGNFNNDSYLDIAVINSQTNDICVFLRNGKEYYSGIMIYFTGVNSQPNSAAIGDANNDNQLDIIVANYGLNNIGILFNYGNGLFYPVKFCEIEASSLPYSVAVSDFNYDNKLDIVVSNSGSNDVAILFGDGNGTFNIAARYGTGVRSRPYTVTIADLDNDNISDIVVANSGTNSIFLLYGRQNGSFGLQQTHPLGYGYAPYSVAATDLNNDGWLDLAIACYGTNHVEILMKMTC